MRAAAVALVLIVGAAVVLWYGNMSNSLVLGGLIGGLAALLLSIPISLTLFSYLSRRHDERLRAEAEGEMARQQEELEHYQKSTREVYEAEAFMLAPAEEEWQEEVDQHHRAAGERNLPVPVQSYPRLPAARQRQLPTSEQLSPRQRTTEYPLVPERQPRNTPNGNDRFEAPAPRRPKPAQQVRNPGFPGYQANMQRSAYQTSALRVARQEAARRSSDSDTQVVPTNPSKKLPAVRPDQRIVTQRTAQPLGPRPSRQLPSQQPPDQYRPKRTVDGSSLPPGNGRALPRGGESTANHAPHGKQPRARETQTDKIGGLSPQTGPMYQQTTGPIVRNPQVDGPRRNPDTISGSLQNPLLRRAPYMYEDDPLRQELAQQLEDIPQVRRSSRYLHPQEDED